MKCVYKDQVGIKTGIIRFEFRQAYDFHSKLRQHLPFKIKVFYDYSH